MIVTSVSAVTLKLSVLVAELYAVEVMSLPPHTTLA